MTSHELQRTIKAMHALSEAIRELGEVPSGHLYAHLLGRMSLSAYMSMIDALAGATLITRRNHLLVWIGPCPQCHVIGSKFRRGTRPDIAPTLIDGCDACCDTVINLVP